MSIKTHTKSTSPVTERGFSLNAANRESNWFGVNELPIIALAWGLTGDDTLEIHHVRTAVLGNTHWESGDCCDPIVQPDSPVIVDHMPFTRCGNVVILNAANKKQIIDESGKYYFVFTGMGQVEIELIVDKAPMKNTCCKE